MAAVTAARTSRSGRRGGSLRENEADDEHREDIVQALFGGIRDKRREQTAHRARLYPTNSVCATSARSTGWSLMALRAASSRALGSAFSLIAWRALSRAVAPSPAAVAAQAAASPSRPSARAWAQREMSWRGRPPPARCRSPRRGRGPRVEVVAEQERRVRIRWGGRTESGRSERDTPRGFVSTPSASSGAMSDE